jgi:glycosyltransferase involved in cell wall biosynthesis
VIESALGGTGNVVLELAEHLSQSGFRLGVIYSERRLDETFRLGIQRLTGLGIEIQSVPLHPYRGPKGLLSSMKLLKAWSARYDVLHLHGFWAGLFGRLARKPRTPIIYSPHGGSFHPQGNILYRAARTLERIAARRTNMIVVSSTYEADRVHSVVRDRGIVRTIPHGRVADLQVRQMQVAPAELRFGVIGRLVREKRHDLALDAWKLVTNRIPGASLVIIGDGPLTAHLRDRIKSERLQRVKMLGFVNSKAEIYNSIDVLLLLSDSEASPLVIAEAQSFGIPAIVTDSEGATAWVEDGVDGLIVQRGNPQALAKAMVTLAESAALYETCAKGAASSVVRTPTWADQSEHYSSLYADLWSQR